MSRYHNNKKDISFTFNNIKYEAKEGDSVAVSLFENNILANRKTHQKTQRGSFCYMGVCFECLVNIDGKKSLQSCKVEIKEGMEIHENE